MPKHVIKSDRNTQWVVDEDGHTWILEKQATLSVVPGSAVLIQAGFDNNKLLIDGDIGVDNAADAAIINNGDGNSFTFGQGAEIVGYQGISGIGDGTRVVNDGLISSINVGIAQDENVTLVNSGEVNGDYGVSVAQARLISNEKSGEIIGGSAGILIFGDGQSKIVNEGWIYGGSYAIQAGDGSVNIMNTGRIEGDVLLGDGDDVLNSLKGKITGTVYGGDGSDRYKISQTGIEIVEAANEGGDAVFSTVTFSLPDNVEALFLLGSKNIDAAGNGFDNTISGNRGANTIVGGDGEDFMNGSAGNDRLTGGTGADTFLFDDKEDKEIVTDFEDTIDMILIGKGVIDRIGSFPDIEERLEQHGADVWLRFDGTRMVIKNTDLAMLDQNDFGFVLV